MDEYILQPSSYFHPNLRVEDKLIRLLELSQQMGGY